MVYDVIHRANFTRSNPWYHLKLKLIHDTARDRSVVHTDLESHERRIVEKKYALIGSSDIYKVIVSTSCRVGIMEEKGPRVYGSLARRKYSRSHHLLRNEDLATNPQRKAQEVYDCTSRPLPESIRHWIDNNKQADDENKNKLPHSTTRANST